MCPLHSELVPLACIIISTRIKKREIPDVALFPDHSLIPRFQQYEKLAPLKCIIWEVEPGDEAIVWEVESGNEAIVWEVESGNKALWIPGSTS